MKKLVITAGAAALLSLGAMVVPSTALADVAVSVQFGPPAPVYERVPAPRPGYAWAPGHYEYKHGRYAWKGGRWMTARPGYAYHSPDWVQRNGRWYYSQGRWDRDHAANRHDRDGDGVPNRYDRNPNQPDRVGYDNDRDGVSNAHDRRPNDPRRQ
ncbi:YXWGXW repeat-containing protein [Variovorax sp. OV329]|uniref:YXWGXW repeat-containing protein n=1 Tax=Variovorax sp. OV329 TaxID=1882825 RepID=UPI0008E2AB95|nr:YXWGXW repeat-containing protein [Variovorax sp. OV329]SFM98680.1 YXWGXW repeat-containing protein [Variovorax sp. OV329]